MKSVGGSCKWPVACGHRAVRVWFTHDGERIEIDPRVCGGQPVIKGTRISVAIILEHLASDESWESLLRGYPELTRDDIQAALEYARHSILHTGNHRASVLGGLPCAFTLDQMRYARGTRVTFCAMRGMMSSACPNLARARADDLLVA